VHDCPRRQAPRPSLRMKNGDNHPEADRGRRRLASFSSCARPGCDRRRSCRADWPATQNLAIGGKPRGQEIRHRNRQRPNARVVFTLGTAAGRAFHTRAHLRPPAEAHGRPAVAAVVHGRPAAVAGAHERQAAAVVHGRPAMVAEAHGRPAVAAVVRGRPAAVAGAHERPAAVVAEAHERPELVAQSAQLPGQWKVE
jgi:hypothetical protein